MVNMTLASPWHGTGVAHETPRVACYNAVGGSGGCVSPATATAIPYFPAPYGHGNIFHISNVAMSSRSFILEIFSRAVPR